MCNHTGNSDYAAGLYSLTISAGQVTVPLDVSINSDNLLEDDEIFRLFIVPESMPYFFSRGNPSTASVIIMNNDGKQHLNCSTLTVININLSMYYIIIFVT